MAVKNVEKADFSGWATKADVLCSDGRTISHDAFKDMDGKKVPLVWQHVHDDPENVLGYAILEHREGDGVYAYGFFNDTRKGQDSKRLLVHGDIEWMSIWANNLVERGKRVLHGAIREVSLVLSGANPEARIENVALAHGDGTIVTAEDEAIIFTGTALVHADNTGDAPPATAPEKTVQEVYDTFTDEQKNVVDYMVGEALQSAGSGGSNDGGNAQHDNIQQDGEPADNLKHSEEEPKMTTRNAFDQTDSVGQASTQERKHLTHDQIMTIIEDAKKPGQTLKSSFLAHAGEYGIGNIDMLFPDARTLDSSPELISRKMAWVDSFMNATRKSPFSRIKTLSADITHDQARAKGYIKAHLKKEEWFELQKRITTATTVYKKQKLDRDDIVDITDFDVVAWLKAEMRIMLSEELARAALIGDGREVDDEDKVKEPSGNEGAGIRSIANDNEFYTVKIEVPTGVSGDALVEAILRARPQYRGTGNPKLYTTEDILTDMLLAKDRIGRRLYSTQAELETALRVSEIVPVPVLENQQVGGGDLMAILVNPSDYTFGTDRGGAVSMFDDFDIDWNQLKYLMETRLSGALTKFHSAIVFTRTAGTEVTPTVPSFVEATGIVTIPTKAGVVYKNASTGDTLTAGAQNAIAVGSTLSVEAVPATGYYFPHNFDADWDFTRPAA